MNRPTLHTEPPSGPSRRAFLSSAAAIAAGPVILSAASRVIAQPAERSRWPIALFTKPFQSLSFDELAARIAELGVEGIEATIREGGHIEPQRVPDELPRMVAALKQRGLELTLFASSINRADALAESQLRAAAAAGVKRYRLLWLSYDNTRPIRDQLADYKPRLRELADLNRTLGIQGLYQNHAGPRYVGSPVWDLLELLDGIDPAHLGIAFDIRHAAVEGGESWPTNFRAALPHLGIVYVKDFDWAPNNPQPLNVPLGTGRVDRRFFTMLKESGYTGPVSLHEEYIDHANPALVPDHLAAFQRDIATLRQWMADA